MADVARLVACGDAGIARKVVSQLLGRVRRPEQGLVDLGAVRAVELALELLSEGTAECMDANDWLRVLLHCCDLLTPAGSSDPTAVVRPTEPSSLDYIRTAAAALSSAELCGAGPLSGEVVTRLQSKISAFAEEAARAPAGAWAAEAHARAAEQALLRLQESPQSGPRAAKILRKTRSLVEAFKGVAKLGRMAADAALSFGVTTLIDVFFSSEKPWDIARDVVLELRDFFSREKVGRVEEWFETARMLQLLLRSGRGEVFARLMESSFRDETLLQQALRQPQLARLVALALAESALAEPEAGPAAFQWIGRLGAALGPGPGPAAALLESLALEASKRRLDTVAAAARAQLGASRPSAVDAPSVVRIRRPLPSEGPDSGAKCLVQMARAALEGGETDSLKTYARRALELSRKKLALNFVRPKVEKEDPAHRGRALVVDLQAEVEEFLLRAASDSSRPADQFLLLVTGDAGASKSSFLNVLHASCLENVLASRPGPVTVRLDLGKYDRRTLLARDCTKTLKEIARDCVGVELERIQRPLVLLLDGYDETGLTDNVWERSGASEWARGAVVTCRSEYLARAAPNKSYKSWFKAEDESPQLQFLEYRMKPFDDAQVGEYIGQYVKSSGARGDASACGWSEEMYRKEIDATPGIRELVGNPFALHLVVEVLPSLVEERRARGRGGERGGEAGRLLAVDLYRRFAERWLRRNHSRVAALECCPHDWKAPEVFAADGMGYCRALSAKMFCADRSHVPVDAAPPRKKWTESSRQRAARASPLGEPQADAAGDKAAAHLSECRQLLQHGRPLAEVAASPEAGRGGGGGGPSPVEQAIVRDYGPIAISRDDERRLIYFSFIHRSLLEFFCAEKVRADSAEAAEEEEEVGGGAPLAPEALLKYAGPLSLRLIAKDRLLVQFLAQEVLQDDALRRFLLRLLAASRGAAAGSGRELAAANAVTVLAEADHDFYGADLRGVAVAGADLTAWSAARADLRGARLAGCTLTGAALAGADLRGADLRGVAFAEFVDMPGRFVGASPDRRCGATAEADGPGRWRVRAFSEAIYQAKGGKSNSWDGTAVLLVEGAQPVACFLAVDAERCGPEHAAALLEDGSLLAARLDEGWETRPEAPPAARLAPAALAGPGTAAAALLPASRRLLYAAASRDGACVAFAAFDLASLAALPAECAPAALPLGPARRMGPLAASRDGARLASPWRPVGVGGGRRAGAGGPATCLAWGEEGRLAACHGGRVDVFALEGPGAPAPRLLWSAGGGVSCAAFLPDGERLACGRTGAEVTIHAAAAGAPAAPLVTLRGDAGGRSRPSSWCSSTATRSCWSRRGPPPRTTRRPSAPAPRWPRRPAASPPPPPPRPAPAPAPARPRPPPPRPLPRLLPDAGRLALRLGPAAPPSSSTSSAAPRAPHAPSTGPPPSPPPPRPRAPPRRLARRPPRRPARRPRRRRRALGLRRPPPPGAPRRRGARGRAGPAGPRPRRRAPLPRGGRGGLPAAGGRPGGGALLRAFPAATGRPLEWALELSGADVVALDGAHGLACAAGIARTGPAPRLAALVVDPSGAAGEEAALQQQRAVSLPAPPGAELLSVAVSAGARRLAFGLRLGPRGAVWVVDSASQLLAFVLEDGLEGAPLPRSASRGRRTGSSPPPRRGRGRGRTGRRPRSASATASAAASSPRPASPCKEPACAPPAARPSPSALVRRPAPTAQLDRAAVPLPPDWHASDEALAKSRPDQLNVGLLVSCGAHVPREAADMGGPALSFDWARRVALAEQGARAWAARHGLEPTGGATCISSA
eukprot:tig00020556_g11019.t1